MDRYRYPEIDEAIAYIHSHLDEPLLLSRLAGHIGYSPFHFNRLFKMRIGVPPLYYVSAIRLQKAKELLLQTNLSVRDVGLEIGQLSLGTFTTRFTEKVGMTPSQFRSSPTLADDRLRALRQLNQWRDVRRIEPGRSSIAGRVVPLVPFEGVVLIGLFAKPIPEGVPEHGTLTSGSMEFVLHNVKPGIYYLMATSVAWNAKAMEILLPHTTLRTRSREPIVVEAGRPVPEQIVTLHPPLPDDPPILISLPLLMDRFLNRNSLVLR
ncbi:helix-turn-helix transcriptional regulator [Cohnella hongkongensis]|uniref:Helix-turn-helix transcriptional regulator n=1 Tax=Cohnella hongkongensis TaxID=178337 RepID=A0ABV9FH24_9BACL